MVRQAFATFIYILVFRRLARSMLATKRTHKTDRPDLQPAASRSPQSCARSPSQNYVHTTYRQHKGRCWHGRQVQERTAKEPMAMLSTACRAFHVTTLDMKNRRSDQKRSPGCSRVAVCRLIYPSITCDTESVLFVQRLALDCGRKYRFCRGDGWMSAGTQAPPATCRHRHLHLRLSIFSTSMCILPQTPHRHAPALCTQLVKSMVRVRSSVGACYAAR